MINFLPKLFGLFGVHKEHNFNFHATAESGRRNADDYDSFNNLPDDIIHHIFYFLGPNDVVRLMAVSKRFLQLVISSPYLSLELPCDYCHRYSAVNYIIKKKTLPDHSCISIGESLLKLLRSRLRPSPLLTFSLRWGCDCTQSDNPSTHTNLTNLIEYIAESGSSTLQELNVDVGCFSGTVERHLVRCLLCCTSLRVVKLKNLFSYNISISRLFSWVNQASSLKKLTLRCRMIIDGEDYSCLLNSSSLKTLKLKNFYLNTYNDTEHRWKIIISCPLLETLTVSGFGTIFPPCSDVIIDGPSLKNLAITRCTIPQSCKVAIQSKCLLSLTVSNCNRHEEAGLARQSFGISAPNLQSVEWTVVNGDLMNFNNLESSVKKRKRKNNNNLENFSSLQDAKLERAESFEQQMASVVVYLWYMDEMGWLHEQEAAATT